MYIKLYQINPQRDKNRVAFESLERMRTYSGEDWPDGSIYDLVFEGELPGPLEPEDLFRALNNDSVIHAIVRQSLSVSDILEYPEEIRVGNKLGRFWYCDPVGFKPVMFDAGQTRKAASAATETARK